MLYYLRKNWRPTVLVCILLILEWGMQALVSLLMIKCFRAAFHLDFYEFLFWIAINVAAWGIYFLICMFREIIQARAIRVLNNNVRHDFYLTLAQKKHMDYHTQDCGEYISWFTNDIKHIESLAWQPFFDCVGRVAQIIWSFLALMTLHWSLPMVSLLIAAIMWIAPKAFDRKMENLGKLCGQEQASATAKLKDLLTGYDVLCQFQKILRFTQHGDACSDLMEKPVENMRKAQSITYNLLGYLNVASQFVTDVLVVFLASQGQIDISVFGGAANLTGGVATGLNQIAKYRLSFAACRPYFDKLSILTEVPHPAEKEKNALIQNAIALDNISFKYTDIPVIQNLTLHFEVGGKYALVGPSGCGKSTVLKIMLGWLPNYSGTITIDGKDLCTYDLNEIQKHISYIEQDVFLFNTTIRENITLGDSFSESQIQKALQDSALIMELESFPDGLDTVVGEGGNRLSGGQKQRVAIARALIHNRSILLIDEGTSALDQKNADIVEQRLLDNPDLTLILVSHHLTPERKAQFTKIFELAPLVV